MSHYWSVFAELIQTPFQHINLVWGTVPLYFALLLNELTSPKANFRTAIQTGSSFLWAGAQWLYPYFRVDWPSGAHGIVTSLLPVNLFVTFLVLVLGAVALASGIRRKYPKHCAFLGHIRFSNYFMITIFPMQTHYLVWTWERLVVIGLFAIPLWLFLHFGLMPLRGRG
jgi:hypothetical protein